MNTASQPDNQNDIAIAEGLPLCKGDSADKKHIAKKRFLIVDDSNEVRFSLRRMLRAAGAKYIDLAHTGEAALDMMAQMVGGYDVVFLDYMMPGISGIEMLYEIKHREIKNTQSTRKIMLTGFFTMPK